MKIFLFSMLVIISCSSQKSAEEYRSEVLQAEQAFVEMAKDKGIQEAFIAFAADSAVLNRGNKILKGRADFIAYFSNPVWKEARLLWKPDFVDVSESGDLAYTYGMYTFTSKDSSGQSITSSGIFHTVWKRQKDGGWKFVWD